MVAPLFAGQGDILEESGPAFAGQGDLVLEPAAPKKPVERGLFGTLAGGARQTARSVGATVDVLQNDNKDLATAVAAQQADAKDSRLQSFLDSIATWKKKAADEGRDPGWLESIGGVAGAVVDNPVGAALMIPEQLPNAGVVLGGGYAGIKAGGALGALAGPGGAVAGGIVGGLAGMFAGNMAIETGAKGLERAAKGPLTGTDFDDTLREGAVKAAVVTGVDALTLGLSKPLVNAGRRAVEKATEKVLSDAGVDIASKTAVDAALLNPRIVTAVQTAQTAAVKATETAGSRILRYSTAAGLETFGEGLGEYLGEYAATGKADKVDAIVEAFSSMGQSAAELAYVGAKGVVTPSPKNILDAKTGDEARTIALNAMVEGTSVDTNATLLAAVAERGQADGETRRAAAQHDLEQAMLNQALGNGTVVQDESGGYHVNAGEHSAPLRVWDGTPSESAATISPELLAAQKEHFGLQGFNVLHYEDNPLLPDGAQDPSQPNTLFLSNNPQRNAAQIAEHEATHGMEAQVLPGTGGRTMGEVYHEAIARGVTDQGWKDAIAQFSVSGPEMPAEGATAEEQKAFAAQWHQHMIQELGADIGGEASKFVTFMPKVVARIETMYGKSVAQDFLTRFIAQIQKAYDAMKQFFDDSPTHSQTWVKNLSEVHDILSDMKARQYGTQLESEKARLSEGKRARQRELDNAFNERAGTKADEQALIARETREKLGHIEVARQDMIGQANAANPSAGPSAMALALEEGKQKADRNEFDELRKSEETDLHNRRVTLIEGQMRDAEIGRLIALGMDKDKAAKNAEAKVAANKDLIEQAESRAKRLEEIADKRKTGHLLTSDEILAERLGPISPPQGASPELARAIADVQKPGFLRDKFDEQNIADVKSGVKLSAKVPEGVPTGEKSASGKVIYAHERFVASTPDGVAHRAQRSQHSGDHAVVLYGTLAGAERAAQKLGGKAHKITITDTKPALAAGSDFYDGQIKAAVRALGVRSDPREAPIEGAKLSPQAAEKAKVEASRAKKKVATKDEGATAKLSPKQDFAYDDPRGYRIDRIAREETSNGKGLWNIVDSKGEVVETFDTRADAQGWLARDRAAHAQRAKLSPKMGRREFLMGAAAMLASTQAPAAGNVTLGKARPFDQAVMHKNVDPAVAKILRGNGATNIQGAEALKKALNLIATTGPAEVRPLAAAIAKLLPEKFLLTVNDTRRVNAHGVVEMEPVVHMTLFTAEDRRGLSYGTILHESLHVAIAARYGLLSFGLMRANDKKLGLPAPGASVEMAQFLAVYREFKSVRADAMASAGPELANSLEQTWSPDEFFVRALTDPVLQKFLASKRYEGMTLLARFQDWIKRTLLGFGPESGVAPSWLDAALAVSEDMQTALVKDAADFTRRAAWGARPRGAQREARFSPKAGMTAERLDAVLEDLAYSDDRVKGGIAWISPKKFLDATTSLGEQARLREEIVEHGPANRGQRTPINLLVDNDGRIVGHEGRHRMVGLADEGVERVAVVVRRHAASNAPLPMMLLPQRNDGNEGFAAVGVSPVPITYGNAAALREMFVEGAGVRFSQKISKEQELKLTAAQETAQGTYLNVGLSTKETRGAGTFILPNQIGPELKKFGVNIIRSTTVGSKTEPTAVVHTDRPLTLQQLDTLSTALHQQAIPQLHNGAGIMGGPQASAWGPFNAEFFFMRNGKTMAENEAVAAKDAAVARNDKTAAALGLTPQEREATLLSAMTGLPGTQAFVSNDIGGIPEVVQYLDVKRMSTGMPALDLTNPADRQILAKMMAAEAIATMDNSGANLEWYDQTIAATLEIAALKYPRLKTDPHARTMFLVAVAVSSQTMNVEANLEYAMAQFDTWERTGLFPETGTGKSATAMQINFRKANALVERMGPELFARFLGTTFTARELGDIGYPIDELADELVLGSSVFGPKIGFGFYSNLAGNFEPVTIDMWLMRTIGRLSGTLPEFEAERFISQHERFLAALNQKGAQKRGLFAPNLFTESEIRLAHRDTNFAIKLARRALSLHEADYKTNRAAFNAKTRAKTELVLSAETMRTSLDAPKDAPQNGSERRDLRDVVVRMVAAVEKTIGRRIPPASLQAVVWYPEQEYWKSLGVRLRVTSQDYAGAAAKLLKDEGDFSDIEIENAGRAGRLGQSNRGADAGSVRGDDGRDAGTGPLKDTERGRFLQTYDTRTPAQKRRAAGPQAGEVDGDRTEGPDAAGGGRTRASPKSGLLPAHGTSREDGVDVVGTHYSTGERSSLASSAYGRGYKGAERARIDASTDDRIKQRVYFYLDTGTGTGPEKGVGGVAHGARLNGLYDIGHDPLDLYARAHEASRGNADAIMNAFESALLDAGFDGYFTRDFGPQGAAVLLGPRSVDVSRVNEQIGEVVSPMAPFTGAKLASRQIMADRSLPLGQMSGERWMKLVPEAKLDADRLYYKDGVARAVLAASQVKYSPKVDALGERPKSIEDAAQQLAAGNRVVATEDGQQVELTPEDLQWYNASELMVFPPKDASTAAARPQKPKFNVHVTFKHPAWDEKEGFDYEIPADTKSEAITYARRRAADDGHTGVLYFKATEIESERKFSPKPEPSAQETAEVEAAVEGRTVAEAAKYLIASGSADQKAIAERVLLQIQKLESKGVVFSMHVAHLDDTVPAALVHGSLGLTRWQYAKGGTPPTAQVWLNGGDVTGKVGTTRKTLLHELVHAATMGVVFAGNRKDAQSIGGAKDVNALYDVSNAVTRHFNARVRQSRSGGEALTDFEQKILKRENNALQDPHEVLAWGMSDPEMQSYLEGIPYPAHESAWSAFVIAIRDILGLPARLGTALSEVLRVGENLLGDNVSEMLDVLAADGYGSTAVQSEINTRVQAKFSPKSPAFKKWFGDSKVVDANGEPLVVYHGTADSFDEFSTQQQGKTFDEFDGAFPRTGFWFTSDPTNADWYSGVSARNKGGEGRRTYAAHLKLENPYIVTAEEFADEGESAVPDEGDPRLDGHDGMIVNRAEYPGPSPEAEAFRAAAGARHGGNQAPYAWSAEERAQYDKLTDLPPVVTHTHYVAFNPDQIKSVFNPDATGGAKFSPKTVAEISATFEKRTEDFFAATHVGPVRMSDNTPAALQMFGWIDRPIMVEPKVMRKMRDVHNLTTPQFGKLPQLMLRPMLVLADSKNESLNFVGDDVREGRAVMLAVKPEAPSGTIDNQIISNMVVTGYEPTLGWDEIIKRVMRGELVFRDSSRAIPPAVKSAMAAAQKKFAQSGRGLPRELLQGSASRSVIERSYSVLGQSDLVKFESDSEVKFSPKVTGNSNRPGGYTAAQSQLFEKVGRTLTPKTISQKWAEIRKDIGMKMTQGIVDQFAPLKKLSNIAYTLARLSKGSAGALEALLHHGKLSIKGGAYDADRTGGFIEKVGQPLQGEVHDFLWWMAANRAEQLTKEDREHLFDAGDIAVGKTLADGRLGFTYTLSNGATTTNRREAFEDSAKKYDAFNKNVLDMAEQSGLINAQQRAGWEKMNYVPFYRVGEDGGFVGGTLSAKLVGQSPFKRLKGGSEKLNNNLLENVMSNWFHLLDASVKNRAGMESLNAAAAVGAAVESDETTVREMARASGNSKAAVWAMDQGHKRFFAVGDPMLLAAITSLQYAGMHGPVMDAMSKMKHYLTVGVTASPHFKVKNLIRDSIQAIGTSGIGYNPYTNLKEGSALVSTGGTFKNLGKALVGMDTEQLAMSQTYVSALASGGLIRFGTMLEGKASARVEQLLKRGIKNSTILNSQSKWDAVYDKFDRAIEAYNEVGNRSEEITRSALFKQLLAKGVPHAEAALQARDLMDFSLQGTYATVRFLSQVVPFFNARLQGMYKLGRGAHEDPKRMAIVLGAVALASISLLAWYGDDDDWKKREDWDRDSNWWFKIGGMAFTIPKPFEIGAIGTLAERGVEYFTNPEMTGKRLNKVVLSVLANNLSMNPIPQAFKPMVEIYANKSSFTGRPIETMGMEKLAPDYRYTSRTSMLARAAGTTGQAVTSTVGLNFLSPVQIDSMLQGYFGWLGGFVVGTADLAARPMSGEATRPDGDLWKKVTGGMISELPTDQSRYVSHMYEQAQIVEQAYGTYRMLAKTGKPGEAAAYLAEHRPELQQYKRVEHAKAAVSKINEAIRMIERSAKSPEEKKEMIALRNAQKDRIARQVN